MPKIDRHPLRRVRYHVKATLTQAIEEASAYHQYVLETLGRSTMTRQSYARTITRYSEFLTATGRCKAGKSATLADLTVDNARAFLLWLRDEHQTVDRLTHSRRLKGPRALQDAANTLKIFARFCFIEHLTDTNQLDRFRLPRAPAPAVPTLTATHCQALIVAASTTALAERNIAINYFLLATGVRADELCGLRVADLDLHAKRACVLGKGQKQRWVYFDAMTARMLSRYLATRGKLADRAVVFAQEDGGTPLTPQALWRMTNSLGKAARIRGVRVSPHTYRHTFAVTWLRVHPGALFHLQQLLGHESLEMVRRYARLAETETPLAGPSPTEVLLGGRIR